MMPSGLDELAAQARHDLARMNFPAANWVPATAGPDGRPMLDVLVVGAGLCGQTVAFALARDGVRNTRVVDRAGRGREGPWGTYARMDTLRSPKHLTGPDLGFPALTFRAWYEAQHGAEGWERLYKVATKDWLAYLLWVRDTVGLTVENNTEVMRLAPAADGVRAGLTGPAGAETIYARKVVLAGGRDGSGAPFIPAFPSLDRGSKERAGCVFHSSDDIDFARFKGGRIGVLGASASAFDNAAVALETGAAEAHMFVRRAHLPQVNKSKWTAFPGFFLGYRELDDRTILAPEQVPVDDECRSAEHAEPFRLGCELAIELLHGLARLGRQQPCAVVAVLLGDGLAHLGLGDVALLGPQGAQDCVRERKRIEARRLGRNHHPAGVLVPVGVGRDLLGVVLRLQHQRHAEMLAPTVELDLVVVPARLGPGTQRHAPRPRHDLLKIERLEDELSAVPAHDVLQLGAREIGLRGG
jgi:Pyridine nucleotide-disulphide oxidoreductase